MKRISILAVIAAAAACGGSDSKPPLFKQPAGTVVVGFSVDDTANKVFKDSELVWKGGMSYDSKTNTLSKSATGWDDKQWAPLYDDGPLSNGGHEPEGATAGDHIFGVAVFVMPPATASDTYEYGLIDNVYETNFGNGWIWPAGPNGTFTVNAGQTGSVKADGLSLKKFGTTDMQLTLDTKNLDTSSTWDTSKVTVKGSTTAWSEVPLTNDGSGKYTFTLSSVAGAGKTFMHSGLTNTGDKPEFIFVLNGKEYKDASGTASAVGVSAGTKASGASSFTPATVQINTGNKNTYITIP